MYYDPIPKVRLSAKKALEDKGMIEQVADSDASKSNIDREEKDD
jgi:hypothetical protein